MAVVIGACSGSPLPSDTAGGDVTASPSSAADDATAWADRVTCGGPGFPADLLDGPGGAESLDTPEAAALRQHLANPGPDFSWLPDRGWREVARTEDDEVTYVAPRESGGDPPFAVVTVGRQGDGWRVLGWADCRLMPELAPGIGPAWFHIDPAFELEPSAREIPVLVHELACNDGEDARGRIVDPLITLDDEAVIVVFGVRPRPGEHTCPGNPDTPYLLVLPEVLGHRMLLDGYSVPAREATTCIAAFPCP